MTTKGQLLQTHWNEIKTLMRSNCPETPALNAMLEKTTEQCVQFMLAMSSGNVQADSQRAAEYVATIYALPSDVQVQLRKLFAKCLTLCTN